MNNHLHFKSKTRAQTLGQGVLNHKRNDIKVDDDEPKGEIYI